MTIQAYLNILKRKKYRIRSIYNKRGDKIEIGYYRSPGQKLPNYLTTIKKPNKNLLGYLVRISSEFTIRR